MKELINKLEAKGITNRQLALAVGLAPSTISRIKNDVYDPDLVTNKTVRLIAEFARKHGVK